jgi:hypothetical protein
LRKGLHIEARLEECGNQRVALVASPQAQDKSPTCPRHASGSTVDE